MPDITKDLKKYIPIFQQAKEQGINEAETSLRIGKFLEDVLGYDVFSEITKEHSIKDKYVDYAIKIDGKIAFFIEIKQTGIELKEKHIEQASNYAANAGVEWILLTNGLGWQLYHLTFDEGIQSDLIWSTDISTDNIQDASDKISLLHKKSISKGDLEDYYAKIVTLSPKSIMQSIFHETTLQIIRRQLKKTTGVSIDENDIVNGIKKMISTETWEAIGDIKIKRQRKTPRPKREEAAISTAEIQPAETSTIDSKLISKKEDL